MRDLLGEKAADLLIERDYSKKPLTAEEVESIFGKDPIPQFLNTRHAVYKERGLAGALPIQNELIDLIISEPNLIRRPVTRLGSKVVIGFDKEGMKSLVGD
ncbi:MAG: hypothetical protein IPM55_10040 [Acidobacteria bacterium]|nr:hypothetical protein [Acidobacteriota bacterium]